LVWLNFTELVFIPPAIFVRQGYTLWGLHLTLASDDMPTMHVSVKQPTNLFLETIKMFNGRTSLFLANYTNNS
jgi:hypothetical protein